MRIYNINTETEPEQAMKTDAQVEAIEAANAHLNNAGLPPYGELLDALKELHALHRDWYRGTAYVTVAFEKKNIEAIAAVRAILKQTGEA